MDHTSISSTSHDCREVTAHNYVYYTLLFVCISNGERERERERGGREGGRREGGREGRKQGGRERG